MSRAGKFIPGGGKSGDAPGARRTAPIRAPAEGATEPIATGGKRTTSPPTPAAAASAAAGRGGSSLIRPVAKNQRIPIMIMSAVVCCLLVSAGWYYKAYLPQKEMVEDYVRQIQKIKDDEAKAEADRIKRDQAAALLLLNAKAALVVDSNPSGAIAIIGETHKPTPATFADLKPGKFTLIIQADGYEDFKQDETLTADNTPDKPLDLGTIELVQKVGSLSLTTTESEVEYSLTGPGNYAHQGQAPDKIDKLPPGDYQLTAWQHDWKLAPVSITIRDQQSATQAIEFPYASVSLTSDPPGATVREGRTVMGTTPISLTRLHPGDLALSVDLSPYNVQRLTLPVSESSNIQKSVKLDQGKNFISASGIVMVWIQDGGFWAAKYPMEQNQFEIVAGGAANPSTFRRPNRPVDTITWEAATGFCDKLNDFETKAGLVPSGYHYSLPTESQWALFSADADIDLAALSRTSTLVSTQDVGYSEPNKYGLFDTLGNVWEWCLDPADDKGDHTLRGGCWLSSAEHFPSADTRSIVAPKYADKFIGFRVVLVPNSN